ncbi:MAG: DUF4091 domain-containing protein [Clostridia bacterium]|nr:DUF4091 domain-containing protein [Clostridia bacterium]
MKAKIISSLEKCFADENIDSKKELGSFSLLLGEIYSFQLCCSDDASGYWELAIDSPLAPFIKAYRVRSIPSALPVYPDNYDDDYLRIEPGLYPDLLEPMEGRVFLARRELNSLWFEIDRLPEGFAGEYPISLTLKKNDAELTVSVCARVIPRMLPAPEIIFTQWFYVDCLMDYYGIHEYNDELFEIIRRFVRNAVRYGQNMILTPVLSPSLDTAVGSYRRNVQLADITVKDGEYIFGFGKLGRFVDICLEEGIKYFEINHFFTQWGAAACPQVYATVDGEYKRIFGWDKASNSPEYRDFLSKLIPALIAYMRDEKNGADRQLYFHISDEPNMDHFSTYKELSDFVKPLIGDRPVMDALSSYEFYKEGLVDIPVSCVDHAEPFVENSVDPLWVYYCCGQTQKVSNRFFAMPSYRTRVLGIQMWKSSVNGFLQWGYNFYNSQCSHYRINPFTISDGDGFSPSGDAFSVYPGQGGIPFPSLREVVFGEGLQDYSALKLLESRIGRGSVEKLIDEAAGGIPVTLSSYPRNADFILALRDKVNSLLAEA